MPDNDDFIDFRSIPVFNKNIYSSNGTVVVTSAAREVMAKNEHHLNKAPSSSPFHTLSKSEMHSMHCVVDGLRLIHRDQAHVKEVLSHCATLENYGSQECLIKRPHERQLSCHFIISGSVKIIYEVNKEESPSDVTSMESLPDQDPADCADTDNSIVYTHGAGEYLAMLSLEGIEDGIAPSSNIFTLEPTELLRIDTTDFHNRLQHTMSRIKAEIKSIINNPGCVLSAVPDEAMDRILPHISKQHFPPQSEVIKQGDESSFMFCLAKGRCDVTRSLYLPEAKRLLRFNFGSVEQYGVFCQECLLQSSPSFCTVTTTTYCMVLKINRLALKVVTKDQLFAILDKNFDGYPSDEKLRKIGYQACLWNQFKSSQVRQHLTEVGGQRLLFRPTTERIRRGSLSKSESYPENLRRFILKGANFEPVTTRIRSAFMRRPKTASPGDRTPTDTANAIRKDNNSNRYDSNRYGNTNNINKSRLDKRRRTQSAGNPRNKTKSYEEEMETRSSDDVISVTSLDDDGKKDAFGETEDANGDVNSKFESEDHPSQELWAIKSKSSDIQCNSNFMRTAVMVTLKTNEIVKKAKAEAEKNRQNTPLHVKQSDREGDRWYTSIHSEHDRLTREISFDKERMSQIQHFLQARAKQRQEEEQLDDDHGRRTSGGHGDNDHSKRKKSTVVEVSDQLKLTKDENVVENHKISRQRSDPDKNNVMCETGDSNLDASASAGSFSYSPSNASHEDALKTQNDYFLNKDNIISSKSVRSIERYVIPKTVPPRDLNLNGEIKKTEQPLNAAVSVLSTTGPSSSMTEDNVSSVIEIKTHNRFNSSPSRWAEKSENVSPGILEIRLSTKDKTMTGQVSNEKGSNKTIHSFSSGTSSVASNLTDNSGTNVPTNIIYRKAGRVRPASAPVFNRKM